jgi:aryl-alcohol dehydrogenase-like predicted oxidoreductase
MQTCETYLTRQPAADINFFDTAEIGMGRSEKLIGDLRSSQRQIVVTTKFFFPWEYENQL